MGLRFQKSVKIASGMRLNLGTKSASISVGGKGGRYTINSNGRRTASIGIPGTGISYSKSTNKTNKIDKSAVNPSLNSQKLNNSSGSEKKKNTKWWVWALVIIFVIGLFGSCSENNSAPAAETTSAVETESIEEPTSAETLTESAVETASESETPTETEAETESAATTESIPATPANPVATPSEAIPVPTESEQPEAVSPAPVEPEQPAATSPAPAPAPAPVPTPAPTAQGTVYWTPSGKSYHTTQGCSSLARSKTILSGSLDDALAAGKSDPCDRCH